MIELYAILGAIGAAILGAIVNTSRASCQVFAGLLTWGFTRAPIWAMLKHRPIWSAHWTGPSRKAICAVKRGGADHLARPNPATSHNSQPPPQRAAFCISTSETHMQIGIGLGISHLRANGGGVAPVAVPVNSALPTISGTTTEGQTLTTTNGTWSNSPSSYAYQWRRGGVSISGATASTYLLVTADVGATISVVVTASNAGGAGSPATSASTAAIAAATIAVPVNSVAPTISGTPTQGQTLTATTGTWTNSPSGYAYQWKRSGTNISGATASTYLLALADVGATITVAVVASNAGGAGTAATSAATAAIASSGPAPSALDAGQWGSTYSKTASVSTLGAGPYTITGLPYGLSGSVSGGVLTVIGTPA